MSEEQIPEVTEAELLPEDFVAGQIAIYRRLKADGDKIESTLKEIKGLIAVNLEQIEGHKWEDDHGYAMIKQLSARVSYDRGKLDDYVKVWSLSDDPNVRACGELLGLARKVGKPSTSCAIK